MNNLLIYFNIVSADILCEFLEVAVHQILYNRELYPLGIFERKRKYNVPVQVIKTFLVNSTLDDRSYLYCFQFTMGNAFYF